MHSLPAAGLATRLLPSSSCAPGPRPRGGRASTEPSPAVPEVSHDPADINPPYIPASRLHRDPANRPDGSGTEDLTGLAETIRYLGILVPLLVTHHPRLDGHYLIKDGDRRFRAGRMAGVDLYPCTAACPSAAQARAGGALAEIVVNVQRSPWTAVEFALKLGQVRDGGLSAADIARFTGLSQATVSYHLELLELDDATLRKVRRGEIPVGAAHEAVRDARAAAPPSGGGAAEVRPRRSAQARPRRRRRPYWDATHPLAALARQLCTDSKHPSWERLGQVACGPCWERAIRIDQDEQASRGRTPAAERSRQAAVA